MKKLGLSLLAVTAMFFYTENVNAQVEGEVEAEVEVETHAQEQSAFKEIDVVALPQPVKDAVMSDFNGAVTEEAWVKEKDGKLLYKLSLNVEGEKKKVYIDKDGNWVDSEEKDK